MRGRSESLFQTSSCDLRDPIYPLLRAAPESPWVNRSATAMILFPCSTVLEECGVLSYRTVQCSNTPQRLHQDCDVLASMEDVRNVDLEKPRISSSVLIVRGALTVPQD